MVVDRAAGPVGEVGGVPEVVPVAVGEEEGVGLEFFFLRKSRKPSGASMARRWPSRSRR